MSEAAAQGADRVLVWLLVVAGTCLVVICLGCLMAILEVAGRESDAEERARREGGSEA